MTSHFDPMEHRIRQAQEAVVDDWDGATVDQRIYALAGWLADRFGNGTNRRNRAKTIVVNVGFPAFGGAGFYAMVLQVLAVLK